MSDFKELYDNEIYPVIKDSGIFSEWNNDYNKYKNLYNNIDKYFTIFTIFCILLLFVFIIIIFNFEDWKMSHHVLYYSIGVIATFGIPFAWTLSLSIKRQYARQKKEKERYYKNKLKELGIYKKILQNLSCDGDYCNKQFPLSLKKNSKLLKQLEKIVFVDDCIAGIYENIEFSIYDCICMEQKMLPKGGAVSCNIHNLIVNFKNICYFPNYLITRENLYTIDYKDFHSLFLKYPNNDIKIEVINDDIIICLHNDRDYFEFCDLSNDEVINYENLSMLSGDIKNILEIIKLFEKTAKQRD